VHLNTVVRPPADPSANPVPLDRLVEIRERFGPGADIIAPFPSRATGVNRPSRDTVREYIKRRPGTTENIATALGADRAETLGILEELEGSGDIRRVEHHGKLFWEYRRGGK
jgi:hypothetical protein